MHKTFVRNFLIFTIILMLSIVALGYILINGNNQLDKTDNWIFHTQEVIIESKELSSSISGMIAAQRGYLISKDQAFLERYEDKKTEFSRHLAKLSDKTQNNQSQLSRLQEIRGYFVNFSTELEKRAARTQKESAAELLENVSIVDNLRNNMERINADFLAEEYALLDQRIKNVERKKDQYFLTLLIGGAVAVTLLMIFNGHLLRAQSKRSAAEEALSEREEIFRLAVEGTQDGVFDWNIKTNEVYYSDQFKHMLGYKTDEFTHDFATFEEHLHPDDVEKTKEYVDLYLNNQLSEYSNIFRMRHKSGRWVWINSRGKMILDKGGKPIRMIGAHTDISASKEYEMRLQESKNKAEQANRAKSDFLAHMSHEIRTPLTTISGASEILVQNKDDLDEKKQNLVKVLNASATTLKDIITDVLDFSKIESGEMQLEESLTDLDEAFEHIISIMSMKTAEKNLEFIFDFSDVKNVRFFGDPVRLRQILINLIGNAVKFTDKGHIHVTAYHEQKDGLDLLKIDIEDTGIGIKEDQFDLVFERFKQADSSVSRKFGGTGLGLPISKKLAQLMGGDILIKSTPTQGSTFSVLLPMRKVENTIIEQDKDDTRQNKINDKLKSIINDTNKVLLVEDYEGNIVVLSYILDETGIQYNIARTGLEALNAWKENYYDLILMDIQMPEMDGFTATSQIRQMEREQSLDATPIIGMTAHALVGDKDKCIEAGMDAYLPKPIVELDLKRTILKFLKLRQKAS